MHTLTCRPTQIIFRDILNGGFTEAVARGLPGPNNVVDPLDFIPPELGDAFNRDVVSLFGLNAFDRLINQYYTPASAELGELVDAGCAVRAANSP